MGFFGNEDQSPSPEDVDDYAECCHIRPLGRPHNGSDTLDNVLCLCANCHVLFDKRALLIADDLSIVGSSQQLRQVSGRLEGFPAQLTDVGASVGRVRHAVLAQVQGRLEGAATNLTHAGRPRGMGEEVFLDSRHRLEVLPTHLENAGRARVLTTVTHL